jgi:MazG family protein
MSYPQFENLVQVVRKLRDPDGGCPWDLEQTHQSLLKFLIEESYEYVHAAEEQDDRLMEEELGDVLLQVLLHSIVAEQRGAFTLESVSNVLAEKMIRRHPHVFGELAGKEIDFKTIKDNWKKIKRSEKLNDENSYEVDKSYLHFPALFAANKIGEKTKEINFDWDNYKQVAYKVEEEWQELKEELAPVHFNKEKVKEELGDFLFSSAQLARHLGINPEEALREANAKFIRRFNRVEDLVSEENKDLRQMTQLELDQYWGQAKQEEKNAT